MTEQNTAVREHALALYEKYGRIELGIDGNAAFALLGPDLQEGESEFVVIPNYDPVTTDLSQKLGYCKLALKALRERLGAPEISFYFGKSHPYGSDC